MPAPTLASSLRQGPHRHGRGSWSEGRLGDAFGDPFALTVLDGLARRLDAIPPRCCSSPRTGRRFPPAHPAWRGGSRRRSFLRALRAATTRPWTSWRARHTDDRRGRACRPAVPQLLVAERAASAGWRGSWWARSCTRIGRIILYSRWPVPTGPVAPAGRPGVPIGQGRPGAGCARCGAGCPRVQTTIADVASGKQAARLLLGVPARMSGRPPSSPSRTSGRRCPGGGRPRPACARGTSRSPDSTVSTCPGGRTPDHGRYRTGRARGPRPGRHGRRHYPARASVHALPHALRLGGDHRAAARS